MKLKAFLILILILTLTVSAVNAYSVKYNPAEPFGDNIAFGKTVASSAQTESRSGADKITDGTEEGWVTKSGEPQQYAVIDLDNVHSVGSLYFVLNEATKEAVKWSVWVSEDLEKWDNVFSQVNGNLPSETWTLTVDFDRAVSARYIKIQSDSGARFGMQEVKAYGAKELGINDVLLDGENVSVLTSGEGIVFVTLLDKKGDVRGVYFGDSGTTFKIKKDMQTKSLKINFLKDFVTMQPIDSITVDL